METILNFITGIDFFAWTGAIVVLVNALIGVFLLVPGDQPEKFLKSVVDFIAKFSRK